MPAKYEYQEEVSDGPRIVWDTKMIVALVRLWDANIPVREIAQLLDSTKTNIRRRVGIIRKMGIPMVVRGRKEGKIDRRPE